MYIFGATILLSGFVFSKGQSINSTEIVYASILMHFHSSSMRKAINPQDRSESNLPKLLIKDLTLVGQDVAGANCAGDPTIWTDEQIHSCLGHINDALSEDFQLG